jgi:hypothetical protein
MTISSNKTPYAGYCITPQLAHPSADLLLRRIRRDERVAAAADNVGAAGLFQRLAHLKVIVRLEELQQRPLQLAVAQVAGDLDLLLTERVNAGVVHARRSVHCLTGCPFRCC